MPICRTPNPYRTSSRSTSFSIMVAASRPKMSAIRPVSWALVMSAMVSALMT